MLPEVLGGGVRHRYVFEHAFQFASELTPTFRFQARYHVLLGIVRCGFVQ